MEEDWLRSLPQILPPTPEAIVPVGDDAAVVPPPAAGRALVVTTDLLVDGVHFRLDLQDPRAIGHKALAVNLSDVAAMGGVPRWAVIAVALPRRDDPAFLVRTLTDGMIPLATELGVGLVGGDTNVHNGPLTISVTALGETLADPPWRRDGARAGDRLVVTGPCGGSLSGRHLAVRPRCQEARWLASSAVVHACTDVSDGLSLDAWSLAQASGLSLTLDAEAIPIHVDAVQMAAREVAGGPSALDRALGDGEDFELLLAIPPGELARLKAEASCPVELFDIGSFADPADDEMPGDGPGLWLETPDGRRPLSARGYRH